VTGCDHRDESAGYQPSDRLRHHVEIRDGECTWPTCRWHARACDFEQSMSASLRRGATEYTLIAPWGLIPLGWGGVLAASRAGIRGAAVPVEDLVCDLLCTVDDGNAGCIGAYLVNVREQLRK
jgi:hypothetical protein